MGTLEIVLIVVVIALVFGARKLPELGKGMGQGIREFKREVRDDQTPSAGAVPVAELVVDVPSRQLDPVPVQNPAPLQGVPVQGVPVQSTQQTPGER